MALGHSPKIVTNGLMMCMDAANTKSYRNYNLANYSQDFTNAVYTKSTGLVSATGLLAPDGTLTATTLTDDVNGVYESFSRGFTVTNDSASYNISMYIRKTTGGTSSRTGFNVSFSTGGTTKSYNIRFNADTGVAAGGDSNLVTSENNNFWRLSFTVSNNATGNTVLNISYYPATGFYNGVDDAAATGSHTVWGLQVTRSATLLPYKTNVDDSANIWYDLSNTSISATLTNGPAFSSDSLVFDGVDDYVSSNDLGNLAQFTCESIIRTTSLPPGTRPCYIANVYPGTTSKVNFALGYVSSSTAIGLGIFNGSWVYSPTFTAQTNIWYHVVGSYDGSLMKLYINGVSQGTPTSYTGTPTTSTGGIVIGKRWDLAEYFNGNIAVAKVYSRALSDNEILQNFNALRGRFGI